MRFVPVVDGDELTRRPLVLAAMIMEDAVPLLVRAGSEPPGVGTEALRRAAAELTALSTVVGIAQRYRVDEASDPS